MRSPLFAPLLLLLVAGCNTRFSFEAGGTTTDGAVPSSVGQMADRVTGHLGERLVKKNDERSKRLGEALADALPLRASGSGSGHSSGGDHETVYVRRHYVSEGNARAVIQVIDCGPKDPTLEHCRKTWKEEEPKGSDVSPDGGVAGGTAIAIPGARATEEIVNAYRIEAVVADRFLVQARSHHVPPETMRAAVTKVVARLAAPTAVTP